MIELVLAWLGCAALCYALGRYNRKLALQRWQFVLGLPEQRALATLRRRVELDPAICLLAAGSGERAHDDTDHEQPVGDLRLHAGPPAT